MRSRLLLCLALLFPTADGSACAFSVLKRSLLEMNLCASGNRNYRWEHDGVTSARGYSHAFLRYIGPGGIDDYLIKRKAAGKSTHVAEFFGSAVFIDRPDVADSLSGFRLECYYEANGMPKRYDDDIDAPLRPPLWQEIAGNLYLRETWHLVDRNMRDRNIPKYDLIMVRPFGGVNPNVPTLEISGDLAAVIINRMYERLSDDDGLMLVDLMVKIPNRERWTERLRAAGVQLDWNPDAGFGFRIIKTKGSPTRLPR